MRKKLMIREDLSISVLNRIKKIIEPSVREIKFHAKRDGIKHEKHWESYISEEALNRISDKDVNVAETSNLYSFSSKITNNLLHILKEVYSNNSVFSSGRFYYPPTGYMGWHTNYEMPEERVYITYASEQNKSFFKYLEGDKVITDYDDKGLTVRRFSVSSERPYFWHCAGSNCHRFSFGYRLKPSL